jgi:hypothetical protein
MTIDRPHAPLPPDASDCAHFAAQLGAWLERDLAPAAQALMASHQACCPACAALTQELDAIIADAAALPTLRPPHDLWAGIEARLEAPVVPLRSAPGAPAATRAPQPPRTISVQWFAIAATVLVAVSSGVTWQLARRGSDRAGTRASVVATSPDAGPGTSLAGGASGTTLSGPDTTAAATVVLTAGRPAAMPARPAPAGTIDAPTTYEREITALRRIVDERFMELDSATVRDLRRNLAIIDAAIADSRAALARDPRSALVAAQLDRALEAKLDLLRRVALL